MATGFDDILFDVYPDGDGYLPTAVPPEGENGPRTYSATVRVFSGSDLAALRNKRSIVTVVPAMGQVSGGTLVIEAGVGSKTLVYPGAHGDELTVDAILIGFSATLLMVGGDRRADLTFLVVD